METRLNIQISSLNENLAAARTEAEKFQQETREAGEKLADAENRNDDLQGEIAGKVFCDESFSWGLLTRKLWHIWRLTIFSDLFLLTSFGSNCPK